VFKKNKFLFISVILHLIIIYMVARSVMFPTAPDLPLKRQEVIQATLIFDMPPIMPEITVEEVKEDIPPSVELEEKPGVAETPPDNQIDPISEPEVQVIPPQAFPPNREKKVEEEEAAVNDEVNEIMPSEQSMTSIPSSEVSAPATSMARRHLNSFQQQQRNRVAEQASRYYQQHKNSPVIDDEVKNPFMTKDEKFRNTNAIKADCSSAGKKTTAVLLSLFGGQIDCSSPPPINSFIQNRINKSAQLPSLQQDQKRPQSVVIKKQP
jgi:hypothetical protein